VSLILVVFAVEHATPTEKLCRQIPDLLFHVVRCDLDGVPHCVAPESPRSRQICAMAEPQTIISLLSWCLSLRHFCLDRACFSRLRRPRANIRRISESVRPINDEKGRETMGNDGKRSVCRGGPNDLGRAAGHAVCPKETRLQIRTCCLAATLDPRTSNSIAYWLFDSTRLLLSSSSPRPCPPPQVAQQLGSLFKPRQKTEQDCPLRGRVAAEGRKNMARLPVYLL